MPAAATIAFSAATCRASASRPVGVSASQREDAIDVSVNLREQVDQLRPPADSAYTGPDSAPRTLPVAHIDLGP